MPHFNIAGNIFNTVPPMNLTWLILKLRVNPSLPLPISLAPPPSTPSWDTELQTVSRAALTELGIISSRPLGFLGGLFLHWLLDSPQAAPVRIPCQLVSCWCEKQHHWDVRDPLTECRGWGGGVEGKTCSLIPTRALKCHSARPWDSWPKGFLGYKCIQTSQSLQKHTRG